MSQHNAFDSEQLSQFVLVFWTGFEPLVMESLDLEADALSIEPPRPHVLSFGFCSVKLIKIILSKFF